MPQVFVVNELILSSVSVFFCCLKPALNFRLVNSDRE